MFTTKGRPHKIGRPHRLPPHNRRPQKTPRNLRILCVVHPWSLKNSGVENPAPPFFGSILTRAHVKCVAQAAACTNKHLVQMLQFDQPYSASRAGKASWRKSKHIRTTVFPSGLRLSSLLFQSLCSLSLLFNVYFLHYFFDFPLYSCLPSTFLPLLCPFPPFPSLPFPSVPFSVLWFFLSGSVFLSFFFLSLLLNFVLFVSFLSFFVLYVHFFMRILFCFLYLCSSFACSVLFFFMFLSFCVSVFPYFPLSFFLSLFIFCLFCSFFSVLLFYFILFFSSLFFLSFLSFRLSLFPVSLFLLHAELCVYLSTYLLVYLSLALSLSGCLAVSLLSFSLSLFFFSLAHLISCSPAFFFNKAYLTLLAPNPCATCLFVDQSTYLPICLSSYRCIYLFYVYCLFLYLPTCLSNYQSTYVVSLSLSTCRRSVVCLSVCLCVCLSVCPVTVTVTVTVSVGLSSCLCTLAPFIYLSVHPSTFIPIYRPHNLHLTLLCT